MTDTKTPPPSDHVAAAWAFTIEGYGPHVTFEKPDPSSKVTGVVPLFWGAPQPPSDHHIAGHITPQMIRDTAGWSQSESDLRQTLQWAADALEAALVAAPPPVEHVVWQPFATAPKNGAPFDALTDREETVPGVWFDGQDFVVSPSYATSGQFVSWRFPNV